MRLVWRRKRIPIAGGDRTAAESRGGAGRVTARRGGNMSIRSFLLTASLALTLAGVAAPSMADDLSALPAPALPGACPPTAEPDTIASTDQLLAMNQVEADFGERPT